MRTESLMWYKELEQNGKQAAQFGAGVTKTLYKSSNSLDVKVELFFEQSKS